MAEERLDQLDVNEKLIALLMNTVAKYQMEYEALKKENELLEALDDDE